MNINYTQIRHWRVPISSYFYVKNTDMADGTLSIVKSLDTAPTVSVQYSFDKSTWTTLGSTSTTALTLTVPRNTKVYLRAETNAWATDYSNYNNITFNKRHKVGGNAMSLLFGSNFNGTETSLTAARTFYKLFKDDTRLTDAKDMFLPATTITQYCYAAMFNNCSNLVTAPALSAMNLQPYCYDAMFAGCTSLKESPVLGAVDLKQFCYAGMFADCTSLEKITVSFEAWATNSAVTDTDYRATWDWTRGAKATGSFIINNLVLPQTKNAEGNQTDAHYIPYNWAVTGGEGAVDYTVPFYLEDRSGMNNTFTINLTTYPDTDVTNLQYSYDAETWTSTKPTIPANGRVYVRANATCWNDSKITATGDYKVAGNIMSLLYGSSFTGNETTFPDDTKQWIFEQLFQGSTTLVNAKELILPADVLVDNAYNGMFNGCTSLTSAPALPATTLAASCYNQMFQGCSSLATAPELPAVILATRCYNQMFQGCSSLATAPELPAVILATRCYNQMFHNCTGLTAAPYLPATTLVDSCYGYMFEGCSNLASVEVAATSWGDPQSSWSDVSEYWMDGVAASGTFTMPAALDGVIPENSADGIPSGWTKVIAS